VWTVEAAVDLPHQVCWQAHVLQGLVEGLCRALCLAPIPLQAFMRVQATTLSGFGLLCSVSFHEGHEALLLTGVVAMHGKKATMSPKRLDFKYFHGPYAVSLRRCAP
jgi:hypothetical protein